MGLWNLIKTGASKFGKGIKNIGSSIKQGVKQAGKWAWENREGIGKAIGTGLDIASTLGIPGANIASKVVKGVANISNGLGEEKFSNGLKSTMKKDKKDKGNETGKANLNENSHSFNQGYSLSTKVNQRSFIPTTREGNQYNSYRSFR